VLGLFTDEPAQVVHPEVGKWMIAAGQWAFGMDPFGWRVAAAFFGALTVLVLARLVRRLTGSTLLGCLAGLLLTFDGLHLVMSRTALLDVFLRSGWSARSPASSRTAMRVGSGCCARSPSRRS
jgi:dolichyl-phosphate-mannose--protein O-mannosyl transferase